MLLVSWVGDWEVVHGEVGGVVARGVTWGVFTANVGMVIVLGLPSIMTISVELNDVSLFAGLLCSTSSASVFQYKFLPCVYYLF